MIQSPKAAILATLPAGTDIRLSPDWLEHRAIILIETQAVTTVVTPEQQTQAVAAVRSLKELLSEVEGTRKNIKAPILALGRKVDALAEGAAEMLNIEKQRIESMLSAFEVAERRRVEEEEARRQAVIQKAQAEADARLATLRTQERNISTEQDLLNAIAAEEAAKAAVEAERQAALAPRPEVAKASGIISRQEMCWECVDVHALYAARPELVRLEPNAGAIRSTCIPEMPVPGLKLWWETRVTARRA